MIRKSINEWLNALFKLEVVEDITQTKLEKSIAYDLSGSTIKVSVKQEKLIHFDFNFTILFRCPTSFDGIGFITTAIYTKKKRTAGMTLIGLTGVELVEHVNSTEMIISKEVRATLDLEYNASRELLKYINFDDALSCQKPPTE